MAEPVYLCRTVVVKGVGEHHDRYDGDGKKHLYVDLEDEDGLEFRLFLNNEYEARSLGGCLYEELTLKLVPRVSREE